MRLVHVIGLTAVAASAATVFMGAGAVQQKMEREGIRNFTKVDAVVACGGATETSALEGLRRDGYRAVINLREASEPGANIEENRRRAAELGLKYIHIPFGTPNAQVFDQFLATVADTSNHPVYIHCASANRVGAVWLAKRVLQDGWPVEKATEEAHLIGLSNPTFEKFALEYIAARRR